MRVHILGAAAGGGFPQWNCGCANCGDVRAGHGALRRRTQDSIAVSARGDAWVLLNASPDVAHQLAACPALHPRAPRDTPVVAIVLTNGDVDHCLGLLVLREWQRLVVYATPAVRAGFVDGNALSRTLDRYAGHVSWHDLPLHEELALESAGLRLTAVPVPGLPPLHVRGRVAPSPADNVGLRVRDPGTGRELAYFPGVGRLGPDVVAAVSGADCVLFDGTFWSDDELRRLHPAAPSAEAMGHVPIGGPHGSLAALRGLDARRRLWVHVNNTNPILRDDGPEHAAVAAAGWEVAWDGLELEL